MGKLNVFNFITLNGYFKGPHGDISWHRHGKEENDFAAENLKTGGVVLLFGRLTYEMMSSYWPTPVAIENDPVVATGMNKAEKIVFSRTLKKAEWNNTRIAKDLEEEIKKLKQMPGKDLTLLGSGSIVTQLAELNLIDEYQFMVDPVIIGNGTSIGDGIRHQLNLELTDTRTFKSGVVLLCYKTLRN